MNATAIPYSIVFRNCASLKRQFTKTAYRTTIPRLILSEQAIREGEHSSGLDQDSSAKTVTRVEFRSTGEDTIGHGHLGSSAAVHHAAELLGIQNGGRESGRISRPCDRQNLAE